jgi:hypothetical protein
MNIFVLDTDTKKAARYHCDKHQIIYGLEFLRFHTIMLYV